MVIVVIYAQILFNKLTGPHPQCFGQAFNVILIKNGAGGLATIGTIQTIDFLKYFFVLLVERIIYFACIFLPEFLKKFVVLRGSVGSELPKAV